MPTGTKILAQYGTARMGGSDRQQAESNRCNQVPTQVLACY